MHAMNVHPMHRRSNTPNRLHSTESGISTCTAVWESLARVWLYLPYMSAALKRKAREVSEIRVEKLYTGDAWRHLYYNGILSGYFSA